MARPVHIPNMFKHLLTFGFLMSSVTTVFCGDTLQTRQGSTKYPMPFTSEIKHPMFDGKEIIVEGVIDSKPRSFIVELCETRTCIPDTEMQIDYRFNTRKFMLNNKRNLRWGTAKTTDGQLLQEKQTFKMKIVIHSQQIKVFLKSKSFEFKEEVRMTKIKYIRIRASAKINWILYSWNLPPQRIDFKVNPLGEKIVVNGFPTKNTGRFSIYLACSGFLQTGTTMDDVADVALDFDVRFTEYSSPNSIIINHRSNETWGSEHIYPNHQFLANTTFQLEITLLPGSIKIDNKGVREYHFQHVIEKIQYFGFGGNVHISDILTT